MQNGAQPAAEERPEVREKPVKSVHAVVGTVGLVVFAAAAYGMASGYVVEGIGWTEIAITNAVMVLAAGQAGLSGFGLAQVSNGLLPLFLPAAAASIFFTPLAILASGTVILSVRQHFQWRLYVFPLLGLLLALPTGTYLFSQWNNTQVKTAIGYTLIFAVIVIALFRQLDFVKNWVKETGFVPGWKLGILAGGLAGFLGGAVGIPGPPMIVYGSTLMAIGVLSPPRAKALFASVFCTILTYRMITLLVLGKVTLPLMIVSALALPGVAIGVLTGIALFNRLASSAFNWIVLGLLFANALLLIFAGQG